MDDTNTRILNVTEFILTMVTSTTLLTIAFCTPAFSTGTSIILAGLSVLTFLAAVFRTHLISHLFKPEYHRATIPPLDYAVDDNLVDLYEYRIRVISDLITSRYHATKNCSDEVVNSAYSINGVVPYSAGSSRTSLFEPIHVLIDFLKVERGVTLSWIVVRFILERALTKMSKMLLDLSAFILKAGCVRLPFLDEKIKPHIYYKDMWEYDIEYTRIGSERFGFAYDRIFDSALIVYEFGFLRRIVNAIVGTVLEIGNGKSVHHKNDDNRYF